MSEPITDVRDLSRIAYGFMASQALFAALGVGVFDQLAGGPRSTAELAAATSIPANRLSALLNALASVGLVAVGPAGYANAPVVQEFLVRGAPRYFGDYLRVINGRYVYPRMADLEAALRGDADAGRLYARFMGDPRAAAEFSEAQHKGSLGPAALVARRVDFAGRRRLLDVGGGSGAITIALCRRWPELTATILDFPHTLPVAQRYVAEAQLEARISHLGGDALEVAWPADQDVILMSYLWSAVGGPGIDVLVERAARASAPGGLVLIHDFMVDPASGHPAIAAWHLLISTIGNLEAACLTVADVTARLERAGFDPVSAGDLVPGITSLVVARRRAGPT